MKLKRTHLCGSLRPSHSGQDVVVAGWVDRVREIGGINFVDLRDRTGLVQLKVNKDRFPQLVEVVHGLGREWVIAAQGQVVDRESPNPNLPTGQVEIEIAEVEVLSKAAPPPIEVKDDVETSQDLRLKYRYVDLRRPTMQRNFELRHRLVKAIRDNLDDQSFLEIETPLLTKPTPEGARDFLVPARLSPGQFYSLPQSPQIFKQILMIAGFDKYFQIARCLRDEDKRGDRQPEFTQLDLEMSFVTPEDVQSTVEGVVAQVMREAMGREVALPLPHLSHDDAIHKYGSDKPDTRFELPLVDLSGELEECGFGVFKGAIAEGKVVRALNIPGGHELVSKGQFKTLEKDAKGRGAKGLAFIRYKEDGLDSSFAKFLSEDELATIQTRLGTKPGDLALFVADTRDVANQILSSYRNDFAGRLDLRDTDQFHYLWVDSFPQFELDESSGEIFAAHHPFVQPENPEKLLEFAEELKRSGGRATDRAVELALSVRATHYDLVVNGVELGSGSIRITDPELQSAMFVCLGIEPEMATQRFGFLLEALKYGAPPMAGIGIGIDRWLMVLVGLETIQDVIAFPKTSGGKGLMDECPAPTDPETLRELGLTLLDPGSS